MAPSPAAAQEPSPLVVAAAQAPSPLVVDADQVVFDQATQIVEATGNVRLRYRGIRLSADYAIFSLSDELLKARGRVVLIDTDGRELRGEELTYDVRLGQAEMKRAETIVDRVYIRSERVVAQKGQITAQSATLTTCDPARPAYRITANQIEVYPGDRLVARRASLWVGSYRVLTLPVLVLSLRSPEDTARSLPHFGYNNVDGFWIDYLYGYRLGTLPAGLYSKYGTRTGFIVRNTLVYRAGAYTATLTAGRNQDLNLNIFDQAELVLARDDLRLGNSPLFFAASLRGGWFRELSTSMQTSRIQYQFGLRTSAIPLGPKTSWQAAVSWQDAFYGTGARQGVLRVNSAITHRIDAASSLTLSYSLVRVSGATPFAFDAIASTDLADRLSLQYAKAGTRKQTVATSFGVGASYSFLDSSTSVNIGYGERISGRYHWGLSGEYNLTTQVFKLTTDAGLAIGRGTYFTVQAIYNARTSQFEDLDYILTSRLCDCVDLSLKYRQVRQELWLEIGLSAFP